MHSRSNTNRLLLSPDAHGAVSHSLPASSSSQRRSTAFPPVDQHIVQPEVTRDEMIRGRKVVAMPALPPHADAQARLAFLIGAHVRKGCTTATELLTNVLEGSDFAMDVCVRKDGIDPETGSRYLEELGFEVINEQKKRDITEKAEDLTTRGVRRVIGIFVKTGQVCEWSKAEGKFVAMNQDAMFEDPMLVRPIAVRALIDQAFGEDEAARALIAKGTASIVSLRQDAEQKGREKGLDEGHKKGLDEGQANERRVVLIELLGERFGDLPAAVEERIGAANLAQLRLWSKKVFAAGSLDEVFA